MYYVYKYWGWVDIIGSSKPGIIFVNDIYTTAKTEAKAAQNIKWKIHKQYGINIGSIKLDPDQLRIVGGTSTSEEEFPQLTLYDLFPDVMEV